MKSSDQSRAAPQNTAADRLTEAAFIILAETGAQGVTSRAVGDLSGVAASAVNYHFGGREGLLSSAFALARARATAWRCYWLSSLACSPPVEAFPGWFAVAMEDYAYRQAADRAVLRELSLDAARAPVPPALALIECESAQAYWASVLGAFGLPTDRAAHTADFAGGMAILHNHRPTRPEQLAWFTETCARFARRIAGQPEKAGWDGWRQSIRHQASLPHQNPCAPEVVRVTIDILGREGLGGLTHRAVAAEAGVSLAAVTGTFPTRAALVRGVFDALHGSLLERPTEDGATKGPVNAREVSEGVAASTFAPDGVPSPTILAIEELLGASGRDSQLREGLVALRAARGQTFRDYLSALPGGHDLDELDAHIHSTMILGAMRSAFARERSTRRTWLAGRVLEQCLWLTRPDG